MDCSSVPSLARNQYLTDQLLHDIAERIGNEWSSLGVYLDLKQTTMGRIRSRVTFNPTMMPKAMLEAWLQQSKMRASERYRELLAALDRMHRRDLMDEISTNFQEDYLDMNSDCRNTLKLIDYLSSRVTPEWFKLGIYLGVPKYELDKIEMTYNQHTPHETLGFSVLSAWRAETKIETEESRVRALIKALDEMRRNDLVDMVYRKTGLSSRFTVPPTNVYHPPNMHGSPTAPEYDLHEHPPPYSTETPHCHSTLETSDSVFMHSQPQGTSQPQIHTVSPAESMHITHPSPSVQYPIPDNAMIYPNAQGPANNANGMRQRGAGPTRDMTDQTQLQLGRAPGTTPRVVQLHQPAHGPSTNFSAENRESVSLNSPPSFPPGQEGGQPVEGIRRGVAEMDLSGNTMSRDMTDEGTVLSI